jgi:septum formation protein
MSIGLRISLIDSTYQEAALDGLAPRELAIAHARGKAIGAAPAPLLTVAADTVVDLDGRALGKPRDGAESRAMIQALSGREHQVHTAFALRDDRSGRIVTECRTTRVRFFDLTPDVIDAYVASGDGLDKAGAYGIQGYAATLVERIDGDYFTVVGFPLAAFAQTLPQFGYRLYPPSSMPPARNADLTEVSA